MVKAEFGEVYQALYAILDDAVKKAPDCKPDVPAFQQPDGIQRLVVDGIVTVEYSSDRVHLNLRMSEPIDMSRLEEVVVGIGDSIGGADLIIRPGAYNKEIVVSDNGSPGISVLPWQ